MAVTADGRVGPGRRHKGDRKLIGFRLATEKANTVREIASSTPISPSPTSRRLCLSAASPLNEEKARRRRAFEDFDSQPVFACRLIRK